MDIKIINNSSSYFLEQISLNSSLNHAWILNPYLAQMMNKFMLSENYLSLVDNKYKKPVLVDLLGDAINEENLIIKKNKFKHLGDVSLYTAGVFSKSIDKSLVSIDYYVQMGINSYSQVSSLSAKGEGYVFDCLQNEFYPAVNLIKQIINLDNIK